MAVYVGLPAPVAVKCEREPYGVFGDSFSWKGRAYNLFSLDSIISSIGKRVFTGALKESYSDIVFENIYVFPSKIDAGYIIDTLTYNITIWNSSRVNTVSIDSVQIIDGEGISLDYGGTIPITIQRGWEDVHTLYTLKDGPATQNSIILYNINTVQRRVDVSGIRVVAFPYEPNWGISVIIKYKFVTAISKGPKYKEQRRPLLQQPKLGETVTFTQLSVEEMQKIYFDLEEFLQKPLAVPVFSEPLLLSQSFSGNTMYIDTDFTYYYYLNNLAKYVIVMSITNLFKAAILEISSIGSDFITFRLAVSETYTKEDSVAYPVFIGMISGNKTLTQYTTHINELTIEFREM